MAKIIKKTKIPKIVCSLCGCEYIPRKKDLELDCFSGIKGYAKCPICNIKNRVFDFKKAREILKEQNNETN